MFWMRYDISVASKEIITCIRDRRFGCAKVVLDDTSRSNNAVYGITFILEILILNKFRSRLRLIFNI